MCAAGKGRRGASPFQAGKHRKAHRSLGCSAVTLRKLVAELEVAERSRTPSLGISPRESLESLTCRTLPSGQTLSLPYPPATSLQSRLGGH